MRGYQEFLEADETFRDFDYNKDEAEKALEKNLKISKTVKYFSNHMVLMLLL